MLFPAVLMVGKSNLDILSTLLDFVDTSERSGVQDKALVGIGDTLGVGHALPPGESRGVLPNELSEGNATTDQIGTATL